MEKIDLNIIKELNLKDIFMHHFGYEFKKKKSSKYGYLFKTPYGPIWIRYDYKTGKWFYTNLSTNNDNGTLIDWIQNHIIEERNIGKVIKYLKDHQLL